MNDSHSARFGSRAAITGVVLVGFVAISAIQNAGVAGTGGSPPGQVLVVTANLKEAYTDGDVSDSSDMEIFVNRLINQVPYSPDIALLQEVNRVSAGNVATLLGFATGDSYFVVIGPGAKWAGRTQTGVTKIDTAILINADTMLTLDPGDFVASRYSARKAAPGRRPVIKNHAYMQAQEIEGGLTLRLSSIHFVPRGFLASDEVDLALRERWVREIVTELNQVYPESPADETTTIGGDFNSKLCLEKDEDGTGCQVFKPFWDLLVNGYGFTDAMRATSNLGGIDYIFTSHRIADAGLDKRYLIKKRRGTLDPADFYSDHAFRWAVVTGAS